ncbi:MAG: aminotransferase class I and II [Duncaniella sp.]|uniref:HipA family kinase n=1 Tax=Duncaniella sp. TaxID=2518496 RepID=UPI0023C5A225|nr:HipA family kinase [Duncaniella sp.]MDE6090413.1 aminotransferase class I and II [Duncaniella sp.]
MKLDIRHEQTTLYMQPLREGGSLPGLVEASDGFRYVAKFRGAGHGTKALIAEFIGSEIARAAGFRVPELIFLDLSEDFGRTEPDEEVQDLLKGSEGMNLGVHFLSGAMTWDVLANRMDEMTASRLVWLDAFLTNIDRTARNTNMLYWNRELWLIDQGASLYFHHSWSDWQKAALSPFPYVKDHAVIRHATKLDEADEAMHRRITPEIIDAVVDAIPVDWLEASGTDATADEQREVYRNFLKTRLSNSQIFVRHAIESRQKLI